ncbi:hypothetical protein WMF11_12500 [Sorangium sp. So ce295]|uniref:hypothetical protein n=1 Tax=Sorangium sp. So ce295 TaxID=3133295 RepID=UPI003F64722E
MKLLSLSRSPVLVVLAGLLGCHKEAPAHTPTPTGTSDVAQAATPPPAGEPRAAASELRCEADTDCVASCARAGQCCDQLCPPCDQAFHRDALAELQKWRAASCAAESCPVAKCMAPKEDSVARCKAGACVVERVPHIDR